MTCITNFWHHFLKYCQGLFKLSSNAEQVLCIFFVFNRLSVQINALYAQTFENNSQTVISRKKYGVSKWHPLKKNADPLKIF